MNHGSVKLNRVICFLLIVGCILSMCACGNTNKKTYEQALKDMDEGRYLEAYDLLETIQEYEDATDHMNNCKRALIIQACEKEASKKAVATAGPILFDPSLEFNEETGEFVCNMKFQFVFAGITMRYNYRYSGVINGSDVVIEKKEDLD